MIKTDGRHRLSLGSYFEIPEAFVLIAIPSWIATDDPLWARLIVVTAGAVFLITTSLLIFNDHTWFVPTRWTLRPGTRSSSDWRGRSQRCPSV